MKQDKAQPVVRDHRDPLLLGGFTLLVALALWSKQLEVAALGFGVAGIVMAGLRHRTWWRASADEACIGWTVFGVPLWKRCGVSAPSVRSIDVRVETRGSRRHRYRVYAVYLGTQPRRRLWRPRNYLRARRYAEALARLFSTSFTDNSTGRVERRRSESLDLSLGRKLRQQREAPEYPSLSDAERLAFKDRGRRKSLVLPRQAMPAWAYPLVTLVPSAVVAIFWLAEVAVMAAGAMLFTLAAWWIAIHSLFPIHLALDERGVHYRLFLIARRIDWADLEELVMHRDTLYLIGDRKRLVLPYAFDDTAEAGFVEALLRYMAWERAALSGVD